MLRPLGYGVAKEPGKADVEEETSTCAHCNFVVFVLPGFLPRTLDANNEAKSLPHCRMCDRDICLRCGDRLDLDGCDPFEKKLERMESRGRLLRAAGVE
jgi:hypothetical protein